MDTEDPQALRKAIDYYRKEYDAIGMRLIQVQRELRLVRRDARRQRTLARVIQQLYAAVDPDQHHPAEEGSLGDSLVAILVESLQVDCAALLSWTAAGMVEVQHSLGLKAGFRVPVAGQMPARALSMDLESLPELAVAALRAEGLCQWLWVASPQAGQALLLGHRHSTSLGTELAFDEDDHIIPEAVLETYLGLRNQRRAKQAEARLSQSEERFRTLFEDSRQAITLIEDGRFVAANQAALAMLGVARPEQLIGQNLAKISPPYQPDDTPTAEKVKELIRIAFNQGAYEFEWEHRRADGEPFTARVTLTAIRQGEKDLLHVVWNDITEEKRARDRIEYLAYHDPLTGLLNRISGQERLRQHVTMAGRHRTTLAVLYLDLDKFKYVNDTHGQAVGDRLLQEVALRLTQYRHAEDTLCRLSGDEFLLVFPDMPAQHLVSEVSDRCERIMAHLAEPFDLKTMQLFTSLSIGVAIYPRDGEDSEALVLNAHIALCEARRTGPNSYRFFEPRMNAELTRFVQTREALRSALERQEFELHYQPQIDLRSRQVVGVEALIRWQRPGTGLTVPGAFIDVAEESGLIVPIGRWVLREACRQAAAWHAAGWNNLIMAVNLSAVQFRQGQVEQDVMVALKESGLDPAHLELELTESILLHHEETILNTISRWKARGIHLSIDDFGTGYSSLAYLRRFKVDKLKIDRSFILDLQYDEEGRAIVQAIIQIARSLNLRAIAEGVEDPVLADQLKIMGCDEAQGNLYSKPLPATELVQWLKDADRRASARQ